MENKNTTLGVVAVLAIVASLTYLYFTQFSGPPKVNLTPFENLGYVVAEETAKLLNNQGRVLVVSEVFEAMKSPNTDAQVKGFKAGLAKSSGVQLKEAKEFKRSMSDDPQNWPDGQAAVFVNMGDNASATVLFVGLPQNLSKDDIAALKESKSKLIVVGGQSPTLKTLLKDGVIHLAIVNRFPPAPTPSGSEKPREWFDRVYMVVTPATIDLLP